MAVRPVCGHYRIFDITFSCDFSLPELAQVSLREDTSFENNPPLSVKLGVGSVAQFRSERFETIFEWLDDDGGLLSWCERAGDAYLYIFPDAATFHISAKGVIRCFLHQNATMEVLRHFLLNQIIPRYLASTGMQLLHAGAVILANGRSVAFLGNSGYGKSTLTSSFYQHGAQLINDDCIRFEVNGNGVTISGGLEGFRLFPDSVNAIFDEAEGFVDYMPGADKQQLFLQSEGSGCGPGTCKLDAIFILNDPAEESGDTVSIELASGVEAMMAIISSGFSLDPLDRKGLAGNFKNIAQALNGEALSGEAHSGQVISEHASERQAVGKRLSVYKLMYPRRHECLADVRAAVAACVKSM